jgi:hypothetical protein
MRSLLPPALAAGLVFVAASPAPAQNDARAVVENAVRAHGGADALNRFPASRLKARGTLTLPTGDVAVESESLWQLPDRFKNVIRFDLQGQHFVSTQTAAGDRVSVTVNGAPRDLADALKDELRQAAYVQRLTLLTPLLSDGAFTLTALGESQAGEVPVVGVKVARAGRRDVNLYFDKQTGLLTRIERTALNPQLQEGKQVTVLSDYRVVDGVKLPARSVVLRDGKRQLETVITEQKLLDRIDDKEFGD